MAALVIRQFDVFVNPDRASRTAAPFVVNMQSNLFADRPIVVLGPLFNIARMNPTPRLNPVFEIDGRTVVLSIMEIAAFPRSSLKSPIDNLEDRRDDFVAAIDFLFTGI